jgi:hypothetical protein
MSTPLRLGIVYFIPHNLTSCLENLVLYENNFLYLYSTGWFRKQVQSSIVYILKIIDVCVQKCDICIPALYYPWKISNM